jgi:hypothetical protein
MAGFSLQPPPQNCKKTSSGSMRVRQIFANMIQVKEASFQKEGGCGALWADNTPRSDYLLEFRDG